MGLLSVIASPRGVAITVTVTAAGKVTTYDGECNEATWKIFDIIRQWKIDAEPLAPSIRFVVVPKLPPGWVIGVCKDELVFRVHGEPAGIPFTLIDEARKEFK